MSAMLTTFVWFVVLISVSREVEIVKTILITSDNKGSSQNINCPRLAD